jgi:hypothetical protein
VRSCQKRDIFRAVRGNALKSIERPCEYVQISIRLEDFIRSFSHRMSKAQQEGTKMLNTTEQQIAAVAGSVVDSPPPRLRRRRNAVAYIYQDLGAVEIEHLHNMRCRGCSRVGEETQPCGNKHEQSSVSGCVLHDSDSEAPAHCTLENSSVLACQRYRVRRNGLANILDPDNTGRVVHISENNHHCV